MEVVLDTFERIVMPTAVRDVMGLQVESEVALEVAEGARPQREIALRPVTDEPQLIQKGSAPVFDAEPAATGGLDAAAPVRVARRRRTDELVRRGS